MVTLREFLSDLLAIRWNTELLYTVCIKDQESGCEGRVRQRGQDAPVRTVRRSAGASQLDFRFLFQRGGGWVDPEAPTWSSEADSSACGNSQTSSPTLSMGQVQTCDQRSSVGMVTANNRSVSFG